MTSRAIFIPKGAAETRLLGVDFASRLADGETISTQVVTATVYSGTDAAPNDIVNGAATKSGSVVTQSVTGGTVGVTYDLLYTVTTSLSQTLTISGFLSIL